VSDHWNGIAGFNYERYNVSLYVVDSSTPRIQVKFNNCQNKSYLPAQLYSIAFGAIFSNVPIPDDALPAVGSDGELSIWDPVSDQLWEFWVAEKKTDGWYACWGGRIDNVSKSSGAFPAPTGVAASGLSTTGGAILINDLESGSIDHAMSLNVIEAAHRSLFSYPANRSDGTLPLGSPNAIREGQRFRLDPELNVDSLGLSPIGKLIAKAAQRYGVVRRS
jgi:hypothetical protein